MKSSVVVSFVLGQGGACNRSEEHTSELQSQFHLVCRLLLEKKKKNRHRHGDFVDRATKRALPLIALDAPALLPLGCYNPSRGSEALVHPVRRDSPVHASYVS